MTLERRVTRAGESPAGEAWTCIHSWGNWEGLWWLWQRAAVHSAFCGQDGAGSCTCETPVGGM